MQPLAGNRPLRAGRLAPRSFRPSAPLLFVAGLLAALGGVVWAALPPAGPAAIEDPREILLAAASAAEEAGTVHYRVEITGTVALDALTGAVGGLAGDGSSGGASGSVSGGADAGPSSAPIELAGTSLEGDVDLPRERATASLEFPGLGATADVVLVGRDAWLRVPLFGDEAWHPGSAGESPFAAVMGSAGLAGWTTRVLESLPTPPRKAADVACGQARCYRVRVEVPDTSVQGLVGGALGGLFGGATGGLLGGGTGLLGGDTGLLDGTSGTVSSPAASVSPNPSGPGLGGSGQVTVEVDRASLLPVRITIVAEGGAAGRIVVEISLTDWAAPVSIEPPAGAQALPAG